MTWEGLFVILALQFRSLLKILDLLHENESMHCIHWRAQRNLWLISTQEESILLVYHRLFDHQHYHRFAQKHVIWIFFFCLVVSSSSAQLGTKDKNSMWDNTERPGHQHLSPLGVLLLHSFADQSLPANVMLWYKKLAKKTRLQAKCHLSSEHHRKGGRGCKIGLQILGHEYLHS